MSATRITTVTMMHVNRVSNRWSKTTIELGSLMIPKTENVLEELSIEFYDANGNAVRKKNNRGRSQKLDAEVGKGSKGNKKDKRRQNAMSAVATTTRDCDKLEQRPHHPGSGEFARGLKQ
ncbi:unnamed protein product [Caenorhabditis nigoni]